MKNGIYKVVIDDEKCIRCLWCVKSCFVNKKEGYDGYFNNFLIKKYFLGYNKDNKIRCESLLGGVCKILIIESLKNNLVDGVYMLRKIGCYLYVEGEFYMKENIFWYDDILNLVYYFVFVCCEVKKI